MKMKTIVKTGLTIVICASMAVLIWGCKKKNEPATTVPAVSETASVKTLDAAIPEQTMCPVMGNKINKDIFVEYQGRKIYFCCQACVDAFNKEPEKYLSKLPQPK